MISLLSSQWLKVGRCCFLCVVGLFSVYILYQEIKVIMYDNDELFCGIVDRRIGFSLIVKDSHHQNSSTRPEQNLNLRRTLVPDLVNEIVQ